jgi:hypothetical protein
MQRARLLRSFDSQRICWLMTANQAALHVRCLESLSAPPATGPEVIVRAVCITGMHAA